MQIEKSRCISEETKVRFMEEAKYIDAGTDFKNRHFLGQQNEAKLSLLILNKMKDLGMPKTTKLNKGGYVRWLENKLIKMTCMIF